MSITTPRALWTCYERVRARQPLVHNITNFVVMNNSANTLLAAGASPAMVHATDEVEEFGALIDALVINVGTLDSRNAASMRAAATLAKQRGTPWVLDPVAAGITRFRRGLCDDLMRIGPDAVRGNASEILTLASDGGTHGKGADATDPVEAAEHGAIALAAERRCTVAVTGAVDLVTDGTRRLRLANGDPMMARVTGLGCCATALVGAVLAVEPDAMIATAAALAAFAVAGELAAEHAAGPGSLQVGLLDTLYGLDERAFLDRVQLS